MTYDEALEILRTGDTFPLDEKYKDVISQLMEDGYAYASFVDPTSSCDMVVVGTLKSLLMVDKQ